MSIFPSLFTQRLQFILCSCGNCKQIIPIDPPCYQMSTVLATYTVNNTSTKPPEIKQGSSSVDLGDVIVQTDWGLSWSSVWNGASATLIGTFFGFVITKASDYFTSRQTEEGERRKRVEMARSCLLEWLEINEKRIVRNLNPELGSWDTLVKEGLYSLIPEDRNLRSLASDIAIDVDYYHLNQGQRPQLAGPLSTKILLAINITKNWAI
jgi:hypothetical protein